MYLVSALRGPDSFATLTTHWDVVKFFEARFPDVVPLTPHLTDNFFANPTGTMVTIKCSPWYVEGRSLLLGDAAHAIVPFFGQGLNCGSKTARSSWNCWTVTAQTGERV